MDIRLRLLTSLVPSSGDLTGYVGCLPQRMLLNRVLMGLLGLPEHSNEVDPALMDKRFSKLLLKGKARLVSFYLARRATNSVMPIQLDLYCYILWAQEEQHVQR